MCNHEHMRLERVLCYPEHQERHWDCLDCGLFKEVTIESNDKSIPMYHRPHIMMIGGGGAGGGNGSTSFGDKVIITVGAGGVGGNLGNKCTHPMVLRKRVRLPSAEYITMCDACGERWNEMGIKPGVSNAPIPSPQPKGGYENLSGQALDPSQGAIVEGNIMDVTQRIKYNDKEGHWEVIYNGKVIKQTFKNSGEAYTHLDELRRKVKEPKY